MKKRKQICRQAESADAMEIAAGGIRAGNKKSLSADAALHRSILVEEEDIAGSLEPQKEPFNRGKPGRITVTQTRTVNQAHRRTISG